MYRDQILDLYKHPLNEGSLERGKDAQAENPSCGDKTHIYVEIEDNKIKQIKHETDGCAISTAAISIVSEELTGLTTGEVEDLDEDWMLDQLGMDVSPMRMKCALLGLETVKKALKP
ncbi:MAG: iron-sulfur cluster assembly scaffold protein [Nanohaloarchaea archaeon]|nr:iron-sulfur cluster assembly scaffold protein [Candidatus Nanohaloarchaea archaeon]